MHWLTSSLVRPECIILLRRVILQSLREYPHGFTEKNVAAEQITTLRERNGRVYWIWAEPPSLVGGKDDQCIFRWIKIYLFRLAALTWLGDNAANRMPSNHCLHASYWIVIFERARRSMYHWFSDARDTSVAFVKHFMQLRDRLLLCFEYRMFLSTIDKFTNNLVHNEDYIAMVIICCASEE